MNHVKFVGKETSAKQRSGSLRLGWVAVGLAATMQGALGASVLVPNSSFELPAGPFLPTGVSTVIDSWVKSAAPVWFDPTAFGVQWNQLSGIFPNSPVGDPRHLVNLDGGQVAFFLAVPEVGLSQPLSATYQTGLAYELTVGVRGGGSLTAGTTFQIGLAYQNGTTLVPISSTTVTATADFATANQLFDFSATVPAVGAGDLWLGKNIGITLAVTSQNGAAGTAYWEVDKVRLNATATPEPGELALLGAGASWLAILGWRRANTR